MHLYLLNGYVNTLGIYLLFLGINGNARLPIGAPLKVIF